MKKIFIGLMALALTFTAVISLTGCASGATFEEISWDDLKDAKLYKAYDRSRRTVEYNSKKVATRDTTEEDVIAGELVKIEIAQSKILLDVTKAMLPKTTGKVCANKDYSKIHTYIYIKDNDGNTTSEIITTYRKK